MGANRSIRRRSIYGGGRSGLKGVLKPSAPEMLQGSNLVASS